MASNETYFHVVSKLYASVRDPKEMRRIFDDMAYFDHELFVDEIFGALSFLLRARCPANMEARLSRLIRGQQLLERLVDGHKDNWSLIGQTAFLEVSLHAWVLLQLEQQTAPAPIDISAPANPINLILFLFWSFNGQIDTDLDPLLIGELQATSRAIQAALLAERDIGTVQRLRNDFEGSFQFDSRCWGASQEIIAMRGTLALSGFVLGWMSRRHTGEKAW